MLPATLEQTLCDAERKFGAVSAALVSGEPLALGRAGEQLRQVALDLSALVQALAAPERRNPKLSARLKGLVEGLAFQRESLIRRTVLVERALHVMVPATRSATYAPAAAPYASAGKRCGAFTYLAA